MKGPTNPPDDRKDAAKAMAKLRKRHDKNTTPSPPVGVSPAGKAENDWPGHPRLNDRTKNNAKTLTISQAFSNQE